jgi:hypothetical protein
MALFMTVQLKLAQNGGLKLCWFGNVNQHRMERLKFWSKNSKRVTRRVTEDAAGCRLWHSGGMSAAR